MKNKARTISYSQSISPLTQNELRNKYFKQFVGSEYSVKDFVIQEIADNDYNLNIPRYVDTFEEEEPIDIDAIAEEIQALDIETTETDKRIASYCKELNIKTPF